MGYGYGNAHKQRKCQISASHVHVQGGKPLEEAEEADTKFPAGKVLPAPIINLHHQRLRLAEPSHPVTYDSNTAE